MIVCVSYQVEREKREAISSGAAKATRTQSQWKMSGSLAHYHGAVQSVHLSGKFTNN
jgi:hypothetical protein